MVLLLGSPIEYDGVRYKTVLDRFETQELIVADWENELRDRIQNEIMPEFPDFKLNVFGRSYVYRAFYR